MFHKSNGLFSDTICLVVIGRAEHKVYLQVFPFRLNRFTGALSSLISHDDRKNAKLSKRLSESVTDCVSTGMFEDCRKMMYRKL